jgi:hypothetical protein
MPPKQRRRKTPARVNTPGIESSINPSSSATSAASPSAVVVPAAAHLTAPGTAATTGSSAAIGTPVVPSSVPVSVVSPAASATAATAATATAATATAATATTTTTPAAASGAASPPAADGSAYHSLNGVDEGSEQETEEEELKRLDDHKLGEWTATAICGNDILSSCLYTSGLCAAYAGAWAPVALLAIVAMLHFFRSVYGEVGTALPLNGGAYNALLNTTSKQTASVAACLTILSYVATGVVSGTEACFYLRNVWTELDVYLATIILLCMLCECLCR